MKGQKERRKHVKHVERGKKKEKDRGTEGKIKDRQGQRQEGGGGRRKTE